MAWTKTYPDGCVECGTVERQHMGRGLCSRCYQRETRNVEGATNGGASDDALGTSDVPSPRDDRRSRSEVPPAPTPGGASVASPTSERRPGDGSWSVPPADGAVPTPDGPKPGPFRRLFGRGEKADPKPPPVTRENRPGKKPARLGRRQSTADTLEDVIAGVGALAVRTGQHQPLGRYLQFSSAVSAEILDEALAGTVVDRVMLQPIVKGRGRFDGLAAVLGPPALILAIERNPERAPVLFPMLRSSIRSSLPAMAKAVKKVQAKEKAMAEAAADLFPDLPPGEDPADAILSMIFDGWTPTGPVPETVEPEPETEERAA